MSVISKKLAKVMKNDRISAIWIIPIITLMIGGWMVYSHFADQGQSITILTANANGIVAGKTVIKSRSVDVGIVESVTLSSDYNQVVIKGQIYKNMAPLVKNDSIFWLVRPQIGKDGVTGLGTLFSGVYIELVSGTDGSTFRNKPFQLSDNPPLFVPNEAGIRVNLTSNLSGTIPRGAPVMFRGFKVGNVENSEFDITSRSMKYQLFIPKPYDTLITQNVRFWKEGGIDFSLSSKGASLDVPSLDVLISGGISFDVPDGVKFGKPVEALTSFTLYKDKNAIQDSQYTEFHPFLLFFTESISGLSEGSPVEYRGIRIGTVKEVPFYNKDMLEESNVFSYTIPVLIYIEPGRLSDVIDLPVDLSNLIIKEQKQGLRASLKSANFFTGALYVDLDFYPDIKDNGNSLPTQKFGYDIIETVPAGLSQLQAKLAQALDNFNQLPLDKTVNELNNSLIRIQALLDSVTAITKSKDMQSLPKDLKQTLDSLNSTLEGIQPGSSMHNQLNEDLKKFENVLNELTPLLNTLNEKSNALIFAAPQKQDPQPKAKGN
ncbi:paraquat-inducible protein B [Orbus hercynius]|uniref:Paraquat-inducible protein B n=1 Tax=Orbus hercynius TaxID=593135 RepID=A0A495RHC6_9GAMM|nr:intermembrane transport protein PqiB [Orbus hercynius]RKS86927.1 paraquat-inducible protein B [Orbus hercynius]